SFPLLAFVAIEIKRSVMPPIAENTTVYLMPWSEYPFRIFPTFLILSASFTDEPPNFNTLICELYKEIIYDLLPVHDRISPKNERPKIINKLRGMGIISFIFRITQIR